MAECVAFECKQTGIYYFPREPRLRVLWENATQIPDFCATNTSRLCSRHFKPTDFDYKVVRNSIRPTVSKVLKASSIPSIFTSILKRKEPSKRKQSDLEEVKDIETLSSTKKRNRSHKETDQSLTVEVEALDETLTVEIEALDETLDEDNEEVVKNDNDKNGNDEDNNDDFNDVEMSPARDYHEESADDDDDDYQPAKDAKDSDDSASDSSGSCKIVPLEPNPAVPMETIWLDDVDNEVEETPAASPADVAVNVTLETTSPIKNKTNETTNNESIVIKDGKRLLTINFPNDLPIPTETVNCIKKVWMTKFKDVAEHVTANVQDKNKVNFLTYDKPLAKRSHFKNKKNIPETGINSSLNAAQNEIKTKNLNMVDASKVPSDVLQHLVPNKAVTTQLKLVDASKLPPDLLKKLATTNKIGTKDLKIVEASSLPPEVIQKINLMFPSAERSPNQLFRPPPPLFSEQVKRRELWGSGPAPPPPPPRLYQKPPRLLPKPLEPGIQSQPITQSSSPKILNLNVTTGVPKTYGKTNPDAARLRLPSPGLDDRDDDVMFVDTTANTGQPSLPRVPGPTRIAPAPTAAPAVPAAPAHPIKSQKEQLEQYIKFLETSNQEKVKQLMIKKKEAYQNNLLRKTIRSYKKKCDDLRKRLKSKSSLTSAFHLVTKNMTTTAKIFTRMQMEATAKSARGRRYTTEEKILALSLYRQSPSVYRLMTSLFTLPSSHNLADLMKDADEVADDEPAPPPRPAHPAPLHTPTRPTPKKQTEPNQNHVKLEDQNQIVLHEEDLIILNEDGEIVLQHAGQTLLQGCVQNGPHIYQNLLREGHKEFQGQLENGVLKIGDLLTAQHIARVEPKVKVEKKVKIERTYQTASLGQSNIHSDLVFSHNLKW